MSDTRQKKYGEAPAPRGPRPAGRATERRSFHEESRNDRERGRGAPACQRGQAPGLGGQQGGGVGGDLAVAADVAQGLLHALEIARAVVDDGNQGNHLAEK